MTARRLALAWSAGCSVGYLVGWLAGSNVLRMTEAHRLARPGVAARPLEPRTAPGGTSGRVDAGTGLTEAAAMPRWAEAFRFDSIPTQRTDGPCTQRSPGGGLVCCRKGAHTSHLFEGSTARDRKADADERIE